MEWGRDKNRNRKKETMDGGQKTSIYISSLKTFGM